MKKLLHLKVLTVMAIMLFALYGMAVTPIVTIQSPTSTTCSSYDVPVTVSDFKNVGAISMVLNFDPAVFAYQTPIGVAINQAINPLDADINVGIPGQFKLGWNKATGITLVDNDVLFTLHFNLLPVNRTLVPLTNFTWSSIPGDCEFAGPGGASVYAGTFSPLAWTIPTRPVVNTNTNLEYCKIQDAIDAASPGNTITVAKGTYAENLTIGKSLTLLGPNAGTSGCSARVAEAIIMPKTGTATTGTAATKIIDVTADNVTIDGFTLNGDNPGLTSAFGANGANIDVDMGISCEGKDKGNHILVRNNIIKNVFQFGVVLGTTGGTAKAGEVVNNKIDNVPYWAAVLCYDDYYASIASNCINNAWMGVQIDNFYQSKPSSAVAAIQTNTITTQNQAITGDGIYSNVHGIRINNIYQQTSQWSVSGNTVTNTSVGGAGSSGIQIWSVQSAVALSITNNTSTGFESGYWLWNNPTSSTITISGGTISNSTYGVKATNRDSYGNANSSSYIIDGVTISNSSVAGVHVDDNSLNTNAAQVAVQVKGNTSITGTLGTAFLVEGADASLSFNGATPAIVSGTPKHIVLQSNGTNVPAGNIDATAVSFDGKLGSAMSLAELFAAEDKIDHKIDNSALGFVTVKASNAYVTDIASATPINNDYTRIRNAVELVANNWIINLHGTFDWAESNAAASWAKGNDGVQGNDDDYTILVPANLTGVTFTAPEGLGNATIQGPGDLAAVNLEGTLNFSLGNNQNWTISNLNIFDFDLGIGMFNKGTTDYNNTLITNNHIRIPKDLNTSVAPVDVNQNIGIHYSFGTNQTISNNIFEIEGNGVSDGTNYSTSIALQSNTSGGAVYDGLKIKDNTFTVAGVPDPTAPAVIRGIWENGWNSDAAIEISGNIFSNSNVANTASLNRQVAFWVTSVSGASKKVEYKNNEVSGFNEGVAWIGGASTSYGAPAYQSDQFPVEIMNNKFDGMKNAVVVRKAVTSTNTGSPALINNNSFNNFVSGGLAIKNEGTGDAVSTCNWFGSVVASEIATKVSGTVTHIPWLINGTDAQPAITGFLPTAACDNAPPVITLPIGVTVNQHQSKDPWFTGVATAVDVNAVTITYDDNRDGLNSCNATGSIVRTWTATDAAGNSVSANQTITVQDVDSPVVVVPAPITANNDAGLCSAVVNYTSPTATDFGFFQGFEDAAWVAGLAANNPSVDWNESNSPIARVASGTDGITSKSGGAHAVINSTANIATNTTGAFSRIGGYNGTFGAGFVSSVDVYFDMSDPGLAANTYGWDLDQAVSDNTGGFLRDFIYHVGGDNTGIYVTVDNNSSNGLPRMSPAYIQTKTHATITSSGWYTMKWETRNNEGFLAVDFTILNASGTPVWTTTINTTDAIATVGGNRYMWFNFVSANKLAIDNTSLTRKLPVTPASLSGTAFAKGETTVTATAEDACGHSVSNSFMVKVVDAEAPKFTSCAPAQSKIVTTDCSVAMPDFTATAFATDNCGVTSVTQVPAAGTMMAYQATPYAVTIIATDEASHTATCNTTFTVQQASISGTLKYSNAVKTPMNKVTLALTPGTGTCITDDNGNYSFTGLCAGTYTITVVDNKNDVGGINSTDAAAANTWGVGSGETIEYVNFLAGDVETVQGPLYINNQDALRIQKYFVFGVSLWPFQRESWSYWKKGVTISNNSGTKPLDFAVSVSGANVTDFDLYGMCTGDFNGSLIPTMEKSAIWSMELNTNSTMNAGVNQEFELPMRAASAMQVGAISMILQIPSGMVNVQDVLVNGSTVAPDWALIGDELRIGWYSSTPVNVAENGNLFTLKLKTTNAFMVGESMEFALKFDPLNELADGNSQVIQDASLLVAKVGNGLTGIVNPVDNNGLLLSNYPNPFKNSTTVSYALPVQGKVTIQVYNSLGQLVKSLVDANQNAGNYSIRMDGNNLMPGIYIAKLRLTNQNVELTGTVKLSVLK